MDVVHSGRPRGKPAVEVALPITRRRQ
jgi:hypothetical protein